MSNVFQFKPQSSLLKQRLEDLVRDLEEVYQGLDLAVDAITKLEGIAETKEEDYNKVLRKYATEVGEENVEVGFLDYSTEVTVVLDLETDMPTLAFEQQPEQLNLFPEDD